MGNFVYNMNRIVCQGTIGTCDKCKDAEFQEGYCARCGRPLDKKPGDPCNFILGYADKNYHQNHKIHIKCKYCNTVTTV